VTSPEQVTGTAREETSAVAGTAAAETQAVAGTAKDQASAVASTTAQAASEVKDTAKEQASAVATETKQQVGNVVGELRDQVSQQSQAQTQRAAGGLRTLADQLHGLANGQPPQSGAALDFVRQVAEKVQQFASHIESQGPEGLVAQARSFARRRPGGFLTGAALAGAAAGRMVKGATAQSPSQDSTADTYPGGMTTPVAAPGLDTSYDYGTATGAPLTGVETETDLYLDRPGDALYVDSTDETLYVDSPDDSMRHSGMYSDPDATGVGYEPDPAYRPGAPGSDAGRI
jgi:hypothetical protein